MTVVFQSAAEEDLLRRSAAKAAGASDTIIDTLSFEYEGIGNTNKEYIRRPMRGIVVPKDTHASLTLVSLGNETKSIDNSSMPPRVPTATTHNFLLQNVTETRNEKSQFITTFGATYAFFFGEQPRLISCTAIVPNSADFEWHKEWWENYTSSLRGTSLASTNSVAELKFADGRDSTVVRGYVTNCTSMISAQDPYTIQISFSMFVESLLRSPVSHAAPRRTDGQADLLGVGALSSPEEQLRLDESSTASVRRLNIKLSPLGSEPGGLSKFFGALNAIDAAIDNGVRQARNILFGRNMVVPVNYTSTGPPRDSLFAEGSGAESLQGLSLTNFFGDGILAFSDTPGKAKTVILRTRPEAAAALRGVEAVQRTTRYYYQNSDEYVYYPVNGTIVTRTAEAAESEQRALRNAEIVLYTPQSIAAFASFGIPITPFPGPVVRGLPSLERQAEAFNTAQYAEQKIAEKLRIVGRAVFAVASFVIAWSTVNNRRELQASITNPNSGNLSAQQRARADQQIARAQRTAEQERLVSESQAESLRGNRGVGSALTPASIVASVIL
jgi:hypothetical protein